MDLNRASLRLGKSQSTDPQELITHTLLLCSIVFQQKKDTRVTIT